MRVIILTERLEGDNRSDMKTEGSREKNMTDAIRTGVTLCGVEQ
jgi:hypothetical protein